MTSALFTVSITNDNALEDDESFILNLSSSSLPIDDPSQVTVIIMDDDGKLLVLLYCG